MTLTPHTPLRLPTPMPTANMQTWKVCRMTTFDLRTIFREARFWAVPDALANRKGCEPGCSPSGGFWKSFGDPNEKSHPMVNGLSGACMQAVCMQAVRAYLSPSAHDCSSVRRLHEPFSNRARRKRTPLPLRNGFRCLLQSSTSMALRRKLAV